MARRRSLGVLGVLIAGCTVRSAEAAPAVRQVVEQWSDGLAEVATYAAELIRYGEVRPYKEVQILVKERFDGRRMVKTDHPGASAEHEFDVLKSARILHFVTGIYDYHQSLTYFAPLLAGPLEGSPLGRVAQAVAVGEHPAKLTLASFEWCGNYFGEWLAAKGRLRERAFSYFDGEAAVDRTLEAPTGQGWLAEDGWPVWARGLAGYGAAEGGAPTRVKVLTSTLQARFDHKPARWVDGTVQVARGEAADTVGLDVGGERTWKILVERSPWRRILSWETSHGWKGRLIAGGRRAYWGEHDGAHEPLRKGLGL